MSQNWAKERERARKSVKEIFASHDFLYFFVASKIPTYQYIKLLKKWSKALAFVYDLSIQKTMLYKSLSDFSIYNYLQTLFDKSHYDNEWNRNKKNVRFARNSPQCSKALTPRGHCSKYKSDIFIHSFLKVFTEVKMDIII